MSEGKNSDACYNAKSRWNDVKWNYKDSKTWYGSYKATYRNSKNAVQKEELHVDTINQKLYYLNEKRDAKKRKIRELSNKEQNLINKMNNDPDHAEDIKEEIMDIRYDREQLKTNLEHLDDEVESKVNERQQVKEYIKAHKERAALARKDMNTQFDATNKAVNELQKLRQIIIKNCEDTFGYLVPPKLERDWFWD